MTQSGSDKNQHPTQNTIQKKSINCTNFGRNIKHRETYFSCKYR